MVATSVQNDDAAVDSWVVAYLVTQVIDCVHRPPGDRTHLGGRWAIY